MIEKIREVHRQFPELTGFDFPAYCQLIRTEFGSLPNSPAKRLLGFDCEKIIHQIESGEKSPIDGCFFIGVNLGYARILHNVIPGVKQIGINSGFYLENSSGWDKKNEAEEIVDGYSEGQRQMRQAIPIDIKISGAALTTERFVKDYKSTATTILEDIDFFTTAPVAFVPFDHFTEKRDFIGEVCHYPANFNRPQFDYMKALSFPPIVFYSNRLQNDYYNYAKETAESLNIKSIATFMKQTSRHETVHREIVNVIVSSIVIGSAHNWLTEAVAQYYGEYEYITEKIKKIDIKLLKDISEIANPSNNKIEYDQSLLLLLALGAKKAKSEGLIVENDFFEIIIAKGIRRIIFEITEYAMQVEEGKKEKLKNGWELLLLIDPDLKNPNGDIIKTYLEGIISFFRLSDVKQRLLIKSESNV